MRWFMELAYRGEPFHGWQVQPGEVTVQSTLEGALGMLMRRPVSVTGAGRTDAGVNAEKMIAHFDTEDPFDPQELTRRINAIVGKDIAVRRVWRVHDDMHARFSATSRTYRYYVLTQKSPFLNRLAWQAPKTLDFEAMNLAAARLLEVEDFTSFSKLHTQVKTNICHVTHARWIPMDTAGMWYFEITADRFLRNMVRAVVGTLVDVGRHKIDYTDFCRIIDRRDRCAAGTSMPAHALYLHDITY